MYHKFFRTFCLVLILACGAGERLHAQTTGDAASEQARIALRIAGLTSAERDLLQHELSRNGGTRIAFACVPAGLLILESTDAGRGADSLRLRAMPGLLRNVAPTRVSEDHITLQRAEELCAAQRGQ